MSAAGPVSRESLIEDYKSEIKFFKEHYIEKGKTHAEAHIWDFENDEYEDGDVIPCSVVLATLEKRLNSLESDEVIDLEAYNY